MAVFIIRNSRGEVLDKQLQWVSGGNGANLYCTPHKDIALNQLVELTSKDFTLRASVAECEVDDKGRPRLDDSGRSAA